MIQYAREEKAAKSHERKEYMRQLEEERKRNQPLSESDKVSLEQHNVVLVKAQQALDESLDDVKRMNQMMMQSKVAAVREAQLQEKVYIAQEKIEEEKQIALIMEIERLKALKMYEEREQRRAEDQRSGAKVIIEQIAERKGQLQLEEDLRAQERHFVLKQIEALRIEEAEQIRNRKLAAEHLIKEVMKSNEATLSIKEEKMLAEKLEDMKILEYIKQREALEKKREDEKKAEAERKEHEFYKMRSRIERAQDTKSEIDSLRAKRAIEAGERAARAKVAREAARQAAMNAELADARRAQREMKERMLTEQAIAEKVEFDRILETQRQQEEADRLRAEKQAATMETHARELRAQIAAREEKALQARRDAMEDGNLTRAQITAERQKLEEIKLRKLDELKKSGVSSKYLKELQTMKLSV